MPRLRIDKSSPVPYYEQLREILENAMQQGRFVVGEQLPSEAHLCEEYDVSRTVVRQALGALSREGLITRYKGRGSFVAPSKVDEHLAQSLTGLAEEVGARGQQLTNRILVFDEQEPPGTVAQLLQLEPDETVIHLERVRSINGEPWVVTSTYLPYSLCAPLLELDMRHRSLYATLEHDLGFQLDSGRRTIEAAVVTESNAELLGMRPGDPALLLRSVAWLTDGRPVEYFVAWHRGDRSRFDVLLRRDRDRAEGVGRMSLGATNDDGSAPLIKPSRDS